MREIARTVRCDDGVANAAIAEAAERLAELDGERTVLRDMLAECVLDEGRPKNCVHAIKLVSDGKKRDDCKYWLPINIVL